MFTDRDPNDTFHVVISNDEVDNEDSFLNDLVQSTASLKLEQNDQQGLLAKRWSSFFKIKCLAKISILKNASHSLQCFAF